MKNSALQGKIKSLGHSDAVKLSSKKNRPKNAFMYNRSFQNFLGFENLCGGGGGATVADNVLFATLCVVVSI